MEAGPAIEKALQYIEEKGLGSRRTQFRLRDAIASRQRYWGEPIPIYFENGIPRPVPYEDLDKIQLPEVEKYLPTDEGEPPLARAQNWQYNGFPLETTTMPGWAGSSWYYLRYTDPNNPTALAGKEAMDYWGQVDLYVGGSEHATGHLLYSRFWCKFLKDIGVIGFDEPFKKLVNQGMIQGVSQKMAGRTYTVKYNVQPVYNLDHSDVHYEITTTIEREFYSSQIAGEWEDLKMKDGSIWALAGFYVPIDFVDGSNVDLNKLIERFPHYRFSKFFYKEDEYWLNGKFYKGLSAKTYFYDTVVEEVKSVEIPEPESWHFKTKAEPEKMSKSLYNVVNPDDIVARYGADTLRLYEMFLGPLEQSKPWNTQGIEGVSKFLRRFFRLFWNEDGKWLVTDEVPVEAELKILNRTLKKVADDIERLQFNTCVSSFMICLNELQDLGCHKRQVLEPLVIALAPFAPHLAEGIVARPGE